MVRRSLLLLTASALALSIGPASAQQPAQTAQRSVGLEEIVVTARKREESLLDIPLSVRAFTAEQIQQAGLRDLKDISRFTPGLQYPQGSGFGSPGRFNMAPRFRGMDVRSANPASQIASVFIDGQYILAGVESIPLDDVQGVEIIRGPQAAYFGRNTFGGAINFITREPGDELGGTVNAEVTNRGTYRVSASVEGPIIGDMLAARLTAGRNDKRGHYKALDGGRLGNEQTDFVSGTVSYTPSENFKLKVSGFYGDDDDGPGTVARLYPDLYGNCAGQTFSLPWKNLRTGATGTLGGLSANWFCGTIPEIGDTRNGRAITQAIVTQNTNFNSPVLNAAIRENLRPVFIAPANNPALSPPSVILQTLTPTSFEDVLIRNVLNHPLIARLPSIDGPGLRRINERVTGAADYTFDNGITATIAGGYNRSRLNAIDDQDRSSENFGFVQRGSYNRAYSVEARVSSDSAQRLRWLFGANYYNQLIDYSGNGAVLALPGVWQPGPPGVVSIGHYFGWNNTFNTGDRVQTRGLFGSLQYSFFDDRLDISLEGRYQKDRRKRFEGGPRPAQVASLSASYKDFLPRVIVNFKPTEDTMLYASWSRGSLPGEINTVLLNRRPDQVALLQSLAPGIELIYDSQRLDNYEAGVKGSFFENRLNIAATGYYMKWKNQSFSTAVILTPAEAAFIGVTTTAQGLNLIGSSKLWGVEFESQFQATEKLSLAFNLNWAKSELTQFSLTSDIDIFGLTTASLLNRTNGGAPNLAGNPFPHFPTWSGSLSATYTDTLAGDWNWFVRGDVTYTGKAWFDYQKLAQLNDYFKGNVRFGVQNETFTIEAFVSNLTNEKAWVAGGKVFDYRPRISTPGGTQAAALTGDPAPNPSRTAPSLTPSDKREFGLRARVKF